jgi:hypothetical protein
LPDLIRQSSLPIKSRGLDARVKHGHDMAAILGIELDDDGVRMFAPDLPDDLASRGRNVGKRGATNRLTTAMYSAGNSAGNAPGEVIVKNLECMIASLTSLLHGKIPGQDWPWCKQFPGCDHTLDVRRFRLNLKTP